MKQLVVIITAYGFIRRRFYDRPGANADVVTMLYYAPLFADADCWQCTPGLIWVNNMQSSGKHNYYLQQLYSLNKGTEVVPVTLNNETVTGQNSLYVTACIDEKTKDLILKIANAPA